MPTSTSVLHTTARARLGATTPTMPIEPEQPDTPTERSIPSHTSETSTVAPRVERPCARCASLNLSVKSFVIKDDRPVEMRMSLESLRSANERFRLGTLGNIRERATTCPLCDLVVSSIEEQRDVVGQDAVCHLTWEMDGRPPGDTRHMQKGKRTRRLRVTWSDIII